jgi:hypothetical protein
VTKAVAPGRKIYPARASNAAERDGYLTLHPAQAANAFYFDINGNTVASFSPRPFRASRDLRNR